MKSAGPQERAGTIGVLAAARLRRWRAGLVAPFLRLGGLRGHTPNQLLLSPQDIRTLDPTIVEDIEAGHFAFAGRIVETRGVSPFAVPPPSLAWTQALMSFDWLRHLRAADRARTRAVARRLVDDWIRLGGDQRGPGWDPPIVARRLLAWLSQSPLILTDADWDFYRRFNRSIGRQAAYLERAAARNVDGTTRLTAAIAVAGVALCADNLSVLLKRATRVLASELDRQILPDGGHISRNPRVVCDLMLDLLPLRQAYVGRGLQAPDALLNALDRMPPMIRLFRHADGALALFNGMGVTEPEVLATLLAYGDPMTTAAVEAPDSGYQRLNAGDAVLVADVGAAPPAAFSTEAHAGCLAFEFSAGAHRIIVNSGAPMPSRTDIREAARATASHSTLGLGDVSSCKFVSAPRLRAVLGARILAGPRDVPHQRGETAEGVHLRAAHDGYAADFGVIHERGLWLASDGSRLDGEDRLLVSPARKPPTGNALDTVVRFHLHPAARPTPNKAGSDVEIRLPDGSGWAFEADGRPLSLEDSLFFAAPDGLARSRQIVVRPPRGSMEPILWSLTRLAGT